MHTICDDIARRCRRLGITDFHFSRTGGDHIKLTVTHAGRTRFVILPSTSGSWRSALNGFSALRHELGLVGFNPTIKSTRRTRPAKKRVGTPVPAISAPVAVATKPTWQETLAAHFAAARPSVHATR